MKLRPITQHLVAGAVLIALPIWAHAAGLGKLVVNSALGQPLSAEIELIAADKTELDSISASLANAQAFQDAKIDYTPALSSLRFAVEKKPNGNAVLKVTSTRSVNDPFLDMLVELNWASGRLVREYTVLLDPPGTGTTQTAAPVIVNTPVATAPETAAPKTAPSPTPVQPATPIPTKAATTATPAKTATKPAPAKAAEPVAKAVHAMPTEGPIKVKRGDTLSKLANQVKPEGVTLEQTLVGLFQANANAFSGNNMNRLKAGAKLKVPPADEMALVSQQKARQEIQLQASDWQAYRQQLAGAVANAPEMAARKEQAISGKITTKVEDKAQAKTGEAKDVLKLSKAVTPPASKLATSPKAEAAQKKAMENAKAEDAAAKAKAQREASERAAMLEKQIQDMQKLVDEKNKKQEAEKAAAVAGAKSEKPPKPVSAPALPATTQSPAWMETLKENPLYWLGGGAVVLLGGSLWWMMAGTRRQKAISTFDDSIMTGADLKSNTVMGVASGGAVNTGDTSFLTDFSQAGMGNIDTHDVDPIAEAEVYMAYGRDAQAEEILKEALTKTPDRQEIRLKLLEIYAARKNIGAFEKVARELHAGINDSESPLWQKAAEMGRTLDPGNPLYGGGKPAIIEEVQDEVESEPLAESRPAMAMTAAVAASAVGLAGMNESAEAASPEAVTFESAGEVLDFDSHMDTIHGNIEIPEEEAHEVANTLAGLNFDVSDLDMKADTSEKPILDLDSDLTGADDDNKLDFTGLDLNLDGDMPDEDMDEVSTKLDLARAYLEMGDKEGAREILQEVMAEGNSNQQANARTMLSGL
ncbi:MAG: FimV/HubP family polar landmark protein [Thiobacillaceae bacterium]